MVSLAVKLPNNFAFWKARPTPFRARICDADS